MKSSTQGARNPDQTKRDKEENKRKEVSSSRYRPVYVGLDAVVK